MGARVPCPCATATGWRRHTWRMQDKPSGVRDEPADDDDDDGWPAGPRASPRARDQITALPPAGDPARVRAHTHRRPGRPIPARARPRDVRCGRCVDSGGRVPAAPSPSHDGGRYVCGRPPTTPFCFPFFSFPYYINYTFFYFFSSNTSLCCCRLEPSIKKKKKKESQNDTYINKQSERVQNVPILRCFGQANSLLPQS